MKITSDEAKRLIESAIGKTENDGWVYHSICVGNCAKVIAQELNKRGYNLDLDKVQTLGYIHDIGKMVGPFNKHDINGYKYMKSKGYDDEYYNICLVHEYLNNDYLCTTGGIIDNIPFRTEFIKNHSYTMYEKIINLSDLMCTKVINTLDRRLIDIIIRYGVYPNTRYYIVEAYKLKKYFDNLLGYNVYDLFPEIKENL